MDRIYTGEEYINEVLIPNRDDNRVLRCLDSKLSKEVGTGGDIDLVEEH